jgi:protein-arginine kinase activator protein McsA
MSNEDLEKLADLIFNKLVNKQKQLDDEYMQRMLDEQQAHRDSTNFEVKHFYTLSSDKQTTEDKLKDLENALQNAIIKEDYIRAKDIQTNINKLKDKGTTEE